MYRLIPKYYKDSDSYVVIPVLIHIGYTDLLIYYICVNYMEYCSRYNNAMIYTTKN